MQFFSPRCLCPPSKHLDFVSFVIQYFQKCRKLTEQCGELLTTSHPIFPLITPIFPCVSCPRIPHYMELLCLLGFLLSLSTLVGETGSPAEPRSSPPRLAGQQAPETFMSPVFGSTSPTHLSDTSQETPLQTHPEVLSPR